MNERDLLILKYLHEFKNITKTANALFISQPALTARIKQLDRELNTTLLHSSNKGIFLTSTGMEAAVFADDVLKRLAEFKERIQAIDDENAGMLKLTAPIIICQYYLPQLIKAFKVEHPKVKFYVSQAPSSKVVTMMHANECHFGFLRNDFGWEDDGTYLLGTNSIAAVSRQPFKLADLATMKRIAYTTDTYYQKMLEIWWNNNFPTQPKVDVMVNSLNLCKEMVYSGLGFGLLPSVFLPECPKAHSIILEDKHGKPIERNTYIIYKKENIKNKIAAQFLQFVKEHEFASFLQLNEHN